jgi:HK97 family phage prohead protease
MPTETVEPRTSRPPRDDLVRAQPGDFELRAAEADGGMPTMAGHFAVFDQWTEIHSLYEGHFLERVAQGAFRKTFEENRNGIRVTFNHGQDPSLGDKVLGPITLLEEDDLGARYEVPLLDTSYNRDLLPGLQAGLYGSSFRFRVTKEEFVKDPKKSATNPDGLPERTVREAQVMEFGPVTYPAYAGATAGVRSLTDLYVMERFTREPARLRQLLEALRDVKALPEDGAALHSAPESRPAPRRFHSRDEWLAYITGDNQ